MHTVVGPLSFSNIIPDGIGKVYYYYLYTHLYIYKCLQSGRSAKKNFLLHLFFFFWVIERQTYSTHPSLMSNSSSTNGDDQQQQPPPPPVGPLKLPRTKRLDRRIPKEQRRRAAASCDYCKTKRNKCERPDGDDYAPCKACKENGIICKYTIPRKRRISSDVPGQRKYEYVDATFYRHESTYNYSSSPSSVLSPQLQNYTNSQQYNENSVRPDLLPIDNPPTLQTNNNSTQYLPQQSPSLEQVYNYLTTNTNSTNHDPVSATSDIHHYIPLFAENLRYIGFHGSYSFLVQVKSLFSEVGGGEGHTASPQTMGQSNHDNEDNNTDIDSSANSLSSIPILPEKNFAESLIENFFNTVNYDFPILHYDSFREVYDQLWSASGNDTINVGPAWLICIYMVFVFGIEFYNDGVQLDAKHQFQQRYLKIIKNGLITNVLTGSSLIDIQSLMLYILYLFLHGHRDFSWNLLGSAVRMGQGMGLHRGDAAGFRPRNHIEREVRKRVWWTLYIFERLECSSLGRPCSIDTFDCTVEYPRDEEDDNNEMMVNSQFIRAQIDLCTILGQIGKRFYLLYYHEAAIENTHIVTELYERLLLWRDQLPGILHHNNNNDEQNKTIIRHRLILHATYHYVVCFLTRPHLMYCASNKNSVNSQEQQQQSYIKQFANICTTSAIESKNCLHRLDRLNLFYHRTWIDVYLVYYTTLILSAQALVYLKENKLEEFSQIREHVIANDLLFDRYRNKAASMDRFSQVAKDVSTVLKQYVGGRSVTNTSQEADNNNDNNISLDFMSNENSSESMWFPPPPSSTF